MTLIRQGIEVAFPPSLIPIFPTEPTTMRQDLFRITNLFLGIPSVGGIPALFHKEFRDITKKTLASNLLLNVINPFLTNISVTYVQKLSSLSPTMRDFMLLMVPKKTIGIKILQFLSDNNCFGLRKKDLQALTLSNSYKLLLKILLASQFAVSTKHRNNNIFIAALLYNSQIVEYNLGSSYYLVLMSLSHTISMLAQMYYYTDGDNNGVVIGGSSCIINTAEGAKIALLYHNNYSKTALMYLLLNNIEFLKLGYNKFKQRNKPIQEGKSSDKSLISNLTQQASIPIHSAHLAHGISLLIGLTMTSAYLYYMKK